MQLIFEHWRKYINEAKANSIMRMLQLPKYIAEEFDRISPKYSFTLAKCFLMHYWWNLSDNSRINFDDDDDEYQSPLPKETPLPQAIQFIKKRKYPILDSEYIELIEIRMDRFMNELGYHILKDLEKYPKLEKEINIEASNLWHVLSLLDKYESTKKKINKENIIMKFDDGFFWYDLCSDTDDEEAREMQHCGQDLSATLVSLRDKNNNPHVTMSWKKSKNIIRQIKGKQNSEPDPKYWSYIEAFFKKNWSKEYRFRSRSKVNGKIRRYLVGEQTINISLYI